MKLLILFFMAAVWLQLPADGKTRSFPNFQVKLNRAVKTRSNFFSKRDSDEEIPDPSTAITNMLDEMFNDPSWRDVIIAVAPEEAMDNPEFRAKWKVTAADEKERERDKENMEDIDPAIVEKMEEFFSSNRWKAFIALSSTKAELMDDNYRNIWGMGELSDDVKNSKEGGDFFQGPQWKEFLELTGMEEIEGADWINLILLGGWIMEIGEEIQSLDPSSSEEKR